jgi:hypothetical protein
LSASREDRTPNLLLMRYALARTFFTEGNQGNKDWESSSFPSPARDLLAIHRSSSEFASVDLRPKSLSS